MTASVQAGAYLHHLQLHSDDPARMARFYADAMDMQATETAPGAWMCEGPARQVMFSGGTPRTLGYAGFAVRDEVALTSVRAMAQGAGAEILPSPSPLFHPGAFAVRDPDGNVVAFGLAPEQPRRPGLRGPLQHLTLASRDPDAVERFYVDTVGFLVSDRVRSDEGWVNTVFTRSNHEHHSLACFRQDRVGVDHHSYEAGDWSVIKDWCDRLGDRHVPLMWGPGRHGPGNNIFVFIEDPDGNWIEISAELEVLHDRPVKEWRHEPRTLNSWGRAIMRVPA